MNLKLLLACYVLARAGAAPLQATGTSPPVAIELVPGAAHWEVR